jgi:predicted phage tail protein
MTLRFVHLHGALGEEFGETFRFDTTTASDTLRALNCAFPGRFIQAIQKSSYRLVRGHIETGMDLDMEEILGFKLGRSDLHMIPVASGAISQTTKGTTKVVLGAALVGTAIFMSAGTLAAPLATSGLLSGLTYGNIAAVGLGLALAGAATLLTKAPTPSTASNNVSASGSATGDLAQEGSPIPLVYGRYMVPGIPISVASQTEDIDVYANSNGSIEDAFGHNPSYWNGQ